MLREASDPPKYQWKQKRLKHRDLLKQTISLDSPFHVDLSHLYNAHQLTPCLLIILGVTSEVRLGCSLSFSLSDVPASHSLMLTLSFCRSPSPIHSHHGGELSVPG